MTTTQEPQPTDRYYKATSGSFRARSPKLTGHRHPAELICSADNKQSLIVKYDPPSTVWFALFITGLAVLLSVFYVHATGSSLGGVIGGVGAGTLVFSYSILRMSRQREVKFDLASASDAVVDQKRHQMAFLLPFERKTRWIVLKFEGNFQGAYTCLRGLMGSKLRSADISGGKKGFLSLVLVVIIGAVLLTIGLIILQVILFGPR